MADHDCVSEHSGGADHAGGFEGDTEAAAPWVADSGMPTTPSVSWRDHPFWSKLAKPIIFVLRCLFVFPYIPYILVFVFIFGKMPNWLREHSGGADHDGVSEHSGGADHDGVSEHSRGADHDGVSEHSGGADHAGGFEEDSELASWRDHLSWSKLAKPIIFVPGMGCVVSIWTVINLSVPTLRGVPLLGSLLWKWSFLAALALLGYPFLLLFYSYAHKSLFSLFEGSFVEYCTTGIAQSAILVQYCTSILIVWLLCVDTNNATLHRYGSMALVSFLVGAVLSVMKSAVLLWWKTKLIYRKHEGGILFAGYLLHILLFKTGSVGAYARRQLVAWVKPGPYEVEQGENRRGISFRRSTAHGWEIHGAEEYMLRKDVSLVDIHKVATSFINNFEETLIKGGNYSHITQTLSSQLGSGSLLARLDSGTPGCVNVCPAEYTAIRWEDELSTVFLLDDLRTPGGGARFPPKEVLQKWVENSLIYCYVVGNQIKGSMEAVRLLDRVLTGSIALVAVLVWIFATGLATTSVIVGLASVFLGLTFVFGDTCKTFFQGVIFAFVTHPFDVGDICTIDDMTYEVKKLNILTTTFIGSQPMEIVIYPNSDLSTKRILVLRRVERISKSSPELEAILGTRFKNVEDVMEFILPSATKAIHIETLEKKIKGYLEDGIRYGDYVKPYWVTFNETGEGIKVGVHFCHSFTNGHMSDALKTPQIGKDEQRSKLFLRIKKLLENIENEV